MTEQLTPRQIAARKAWDTMRARKAAALAGTAVAAAISVATPAPAAPRQVIHNVSTDADFAHLKPYRAPELEPVDEFRFVSLHLDDSPVGCGIREFVVLAMSVREVKLFYPPSLETITIHRQTFDRHALPVSRKRYSRDRIAANIRRRIALADRVNDREQCSAMCDGGVDAQRVLQMIEEA
jgi:hypothetical protein